MNNQIKKCIYVLLTLLLLGVLIGIGSIFGTSRSNDRLITQIRKYYKSTNTVQGFRTWGDSVRRNKIPLNAEISHGKWVNTFFHKGEEYDQKNYQSIDSLTQQPYFKTLHPINQFYTYYYIAFGYYNISDFHKALSYYMKANQIINENQEDYTVERKKLMKLMYYISSYLIKDSQMLYKHLEEELQEALVEKDSNLIAAHSNSLAYQNTQLKQHEEAKQFALLAIEHIGKDYENPIFVYSLVKVVECYYREKNIPKANAYLQWIDSLHTQHKISTQKYLLFQALRLSTTYGIHPVRGLEAQTNQLLSQFEENCQNRYPLYLLHELLAKIARTSQQKEKEILHLEKTVYFLTQCGDMSQDYLTKAFSISNQLIEIYNELNNPSQELLWLRKKEELEHLVQNNQQSYLKMMEFFTHREVHYAQQDLALQTKNVEKRNLIIIYISALVFIMIIALLYIIKLFKRNQQYQKRLLKKTQLLNQKNQHITQQNSKYESLLNQLQETNENLENFAKVAAHDIKSPIATIHNIIDYLKAKYTHVVDKNDQEMFSFLHSSSLHLAEMINTLLSYSQNKKAVIRNKAVDVNQILGSIQNKLHTLIQEKNAIIEIEEFIPNLKGNKNLLSQLFQNLIQNALKFQKPNHQPQIHVKFQANEKEVCILIKDNGIGIKEEDQKDIFKIFQRVDNDAQYEGSGIGLATCKKIVKDHGGKIWVDSQLGVGTTFFILLPRYSSEVQRKYAPHSSTS